ncbi:MAG: hypothetical protein HUU01_16030 [Saprospiraceae bacterium]|nr:hypothetical protein [Saprospiraceae bacterium]
MNTFKLFKVSGSAALIFALSFTSCEKAVEDFQPAPGTAGTLSLLAPGQTANIYLSSNTTPVMGVYDVTNLASISSKTINVGNNDSDGILAYPSGDPVFQLDRSNNRINAYNTISTAANGSSPAPSAMSTSDFTNGREITVSQGRLVAIQDADPSNGNVNKFLVYRASPFSVSLFKSFTANINLWGLQAVGESMYAVEDNSGNLAFYSDFFNKQSGTMVTPDWKVNIAGLVRTHGIQYDTEADIMVLTDVGEAASATDGAIHIITNFSQKVATALGGGTTGTIALNQQIRIAGSNTLLGNPVDVAYNNATNKIYVAERANGGGRLLIFNFPESSGNPAPAVNLPFAGASAIALNIKNGSSSF